jgi:hypothetical protein
MVKPKLGVVCHYEDEDGLGDAVHKEYDGPFVIGVVLDVRLSIGDSLFARLPCVLCLIKRKSG